ncbi:MAG: hypothetical protein HZB23_00090 [Deltaproteobacteria bacterium]|nr:hypothetical protein [Deltaproteobacteria bacterium]
MKRRILMCLAVFSMFCLASSGINAAVGDFALIHDFAGGNDDGSNQYSQRLITDGAKLYAITEQGGDNNLGTIYSMNMDGGGFTLLHDFASGQTDGGYPTGSLLHSAGKLYGTAVYGGRFGNWGVIFSMNTDGSGFTLIHEFAGFPADGALPVASLLLYSGKLCGLTNAGGSIGRGTAFSMNTDGSASALIHEFAGGVDDGSYPYGSLVLSGSKFFGMTRWGGDNDKGVIFSMNPDGSGFTLLHEFAGGSNDGAEPFGTPIVSGGKLYGMTNLGGDNDKGVIFSMNMDGSGFTLLHEFAGGSNDGSFPLGDLAIYDSKLYGMTGQGGDNNFGVLFSIKTDGTEFSLLKELSGPDGRTPNFEAPLISGGFLYGATYRGGSNDRGVVFKYELPAPAPQPPVVPHCFAQIKSPPKLIQPRGRFPRLMKRQATSCKKSSSEVKSFTSFVSFLVASTGKIELKFDN